MKQLLFIPLLTICAAAAGLGVCRALRWGAHPKELTVAAIICALAGLVALIPALLARPSGMAAVSQSGLFGTVIHMFLAILLSAVAWVAKLAGEQKPFLFWLLAFYWVSLVAVVIALTGVVRETARAQAKVSPVPTSPTSGPRATPQPTAVSRSS